MQLFTVLLILGCLSSLTTSRPADPVKEDDSEPGEAEYEKNDDTVSDDYLSEDQEASMDEAERKIIRPDGNLQDSQILERSPDVEMAVDQNFPKNRYGKFSGDNLEIERDPHEIVNMNREADRYSSEKENPKKLTDLDGASNAAEAEEFYSHRNQFKLPQSDSSINLRSSYKAADYVGDLFFKNKPTHVETENQNNNVEINEKEQPNFFKKHYYNMHSGNKDQIDEKQYKYRHLNDRDRRQVNDKAEEISDVTSTSNENEVDVTNESNENAIIRNIKKLSEQDLEDLLNSLPEDKRAVLKKMMDKREITKKAGAVDENNNLESGLLDTSKVEGFSADSKTDSSLSCNTAETSKNTESEDVVNTKIPESNNGSGASGSKSEIINNSDVKEDKSDIQDLNTNAKNEANIKSDSKEISKNENKRETNRNDIINEKITSSDSKSINYELDTKESNNFAIDKDDIRSEIEELSEIGNDAHKVINGISNAYKRELTPSETSDSDNVINSLEDSFPNDNLYGDSNLEMNMLPLIRVKRTGKDNILKRKNIRSLSNLNKVAFSQVDSNDCENMEKNEAEDYDALGVKSHCAVSDQNFDLSKEDLDNGQIQLRPAIGSRMQMLESDKIGLGSDADNVATGIEGVDDNLMYNNGIRVKRSKENFDACNHISNSINSRRNVRTVQPINVDLQSDNSINVAQYRESEAFGPLSRNFEENINRYKRVRQTKHIPAYKDKIV